MAKKRNATPQIAEKSVLILASLAGGPKHGYALIHDVRSFSGTTLGPGTLYGCLARLEKQGLVEALPADDRRLPYRITQPGLDVLKERLSDSARVAKVGLARINAQVT
jgi:DNA-binding PadR family transcriptional regulator